MALKAGTHRLGPRDGALQVRTYREGVASKVGHDLIIDVAQWEATLVVADDAAQSTLELSAHPASLEVREGLGGVKPLSDSDREEIRRNVHDRVLGGRRIEFRSRAAEARDDGRLGLHGELTMAGKAAPATVELALEPDGRVRGAVALVQSQWGIEPYRGLMGALKVRDSVEVVFDGRLSAADVGPPSPGS